jgi:hypothetical protein
MAAFSSAAIPFPLPRCEPLNRVISSGQSRYFDVVPHLMSLMHLIGKFRIWAHNRPASSRSAQAHRISLTVYTSNKI